MNEQRRKSDRNPLAALRDITRNLRALGTAAAVCLPIGAGAMGVFWHGYAEPRVQKQIDEKVDPVIRALEYQMCLMKSQMSDSAIARANDLYLKSQHIPKVPK